MAIKICLDAGHFGKYNRSPVVPAYYESDMNWKLHLLLKKELEQYGIEVITTREKQDVDKGLTERGKCAAGCNLFLSIHSNSADRESADYPLAVVPIDGSGDALGKKLASCIRDVMGTTEAADMWSKKSSRGYDWYGVIRGAADVGVTGIILEHSFHSNTRATNWLLNDSNLQKMAAAEAKVIADHYGLKKKEENTGNAAVVYRVQVGAFTEKAYAEVLLEWLRSIGYTDACIVAEESKAQTAPEVKPAPVQPAAKSIDDLAREVINGDWGNGAERKQRLTAAGYDYSAIQKRVNEMLKG